MVSKCPSSVGLGRLPVPIGCKTTVTQTPHQPALEVSQMSAVAHALAS